MNESRYVVAVAALALAGGLSAQDSASAPANMEIANPSLVIVQGATIPAHIQTTNGQTHAAPTTCRFRFHVPAGSNPLAWRQASDPLFSADGKTCEATFYQGELTAEFRSANSLPAIPYVCGGQYSCRVDYTSAFLDPLNIETTHLAAEVTWSFNQVGTDGCCYARYTAGGLYPYALASTGNVEVSQWAATGLNTPGLVSWTGYSGSAEFTNGFFPGCSPTSPMYYYYDPVQVYGYPDGSYDGFDSSYLTGPGGCYVLLHHTVYFTVIGKD